jgi:hypothetical protein
VSITTETIDDWPKLVVFGIGYERYNNLLKDVYPLLSGLGIKLA